MRKIVIGWLACMVVMLLGGTGLAPGQTTVEWEFFEDVVRGLATDVLDDFFREGLTPEYTASLQNRLAEVQAQLRTYQASGAYPSEAVFRTIQQIVATLQVVTASIEAGRIPVEVEEEMTRLQHLVHPPSSETEQSAPSVHVDVSYVYRPACQGREFQPITDNTVLHSGDCYKIIFTPAEDCYVYVFQTDSAGAVYELFPMESFGGVTLNNFNPVQGGTRYYIPAEDKSFRLDDQTGTEYFYFLVSRERDDQLEQRYKRILLARRQPDERKTEFAHKGLVQTIRTKGILDIIPDDDQNDVVSWQEAGQTFSATPQRLQGECHECASMLRFEHQ